ncbi:MAG: serine/threonine-protein kinase [Polyangiaceae bacterium]
MTSRSRRVPSVTKYEVLEELGHGGMAAVFRAHDKRLARDVAIKVIHPHLRDSKEVTHRFQVEAKAVAKLRHPNIVEVFDVSAEDEDEQYLVVELVRGATLRKILGDRGVVPPEVAACIGVELLAALAHAHGQGVVHRDIKPENVMIEHAAPSSKPDVSGVVSTDPEAPSGERVHVKLTDFGIAKLLDAQGVTSTGQVLGSPAHMAPEQIEGQEVDGRADVFGMGVLLYECMVGHLPFEGANPAQVLRRVLEGHYPNAEHERGTVGKRWSTILDQALAQKPADRFRDATALRDALLAELKRIGIFAPREELEAWFDDPAGYAARHDAKMITTLCATGAALHKAGDALGAAADYNRALAYAPSDPALLKLVAGMRRAEARARLLALAFRVGAVVLSLVLLVFIGVRIRSSRIVTLPPSTPTTDPTTPVASPQPSTAVTGVATDPVRTSPPPIPPPAPPNVRPASPAPKVVMRQVVVSGVRPPFGVLVSVDGSGEQPVSAGMRLPVDSKQHVLKFSCANDYCQPQERTIAANESDDSLKVSLDLKPAVLVVLGRSGQSYRLTEQPTLEVRPGAPTRVPMKAGKEAVHIVELPSNVSKRVTITAGAEARVEFSEGPPP